MLIEIPAFAGESDFDGVNNCAGNTPTPMVQCLQERLDNMPAVDQEIFALALKRLNA